MLTCGLAQVQPIRDQTFAAHLATFLLPSGALEQRTFLALALQRTADQFCLIRHNMFDFSCASACNPPNPGANTVKAILFFVAFGGSLFVI